MAKMINYGDSLFLLGEITRTVKDGFQLEVDSATFLDRLVNDISFIESTLDRLYESLHASPLLIDRNEHLASLMRTENLLADVLDDAAAGKSRLNAEIKPYVERFRTISTRCRARAKSVLALIESAEPAVSESGDMISPAEYEFLLVDTQEEERNDAERA
jgi:hypothetical protein